jgi:Holliday junction DNA helicase RuvB
MYETQTYHQCARCEGDYYSIGETNPKGFCPKCLLSNSKDKPQEIVIKAELLDTSKLGESNEKQEFRPTSWEQYIGQSSAKEKVQSYIEGCKKFGDIYPHTFISAPSGMGKSLFATILANQLNRKIVFTTGGELRNEQMFIDKLVESESNIVFIDEANRLPKRVGFYILPLMEQFSLGGKNIKKFILIFATTHVGDISKDLDALLQRCDRINLEPYKTEELVDIVEQYRKMQYPSVKIPDDTLLEIVKSSRNIPRNAKNLVRAYAYNQDWEMIKKYNNIVVDGLTTTDIQALKYLEKCGGAGQNSIANFLRMKSQTYQFEIEPYLIYRELIEVSNKRKISDKGKQLLKGGLK